jgi:hypothetical protein
MHLELQYQRTRTAGDEPMQRALWLGSEPRSSQVGDEGTESDTLQTLVPPLDGGPSQGARLEEDGAGNAVTDRASQERSRRFWEEP